MRLIHDNEVNTSSDGADVGKRAPGRLVNLLQPSDNQSVAHDGSGGVRAPPAVYINRSVPERAPSLFKLLNRLLTELL